MQNCILKTLCVCERENECDPFTETCQFEKKYDEGTFVMVVFVVFVTAVFVVVVISIEERMCKHLSLADRQS